MFTAALASSRKRIRNRLVISPTKNLELLSVDRNSEATYVDASGVIQTAQPNELRVDYSTGAAKILSEGQSTNLFPHSTPSMTNWSRSNISFNENIVTAPDGSTTGARAVPPDDTVINYFHRNLSLTDQTMYSQSIHAKAGAFRVLQISPSVGFSSTHQNFDLSSGVLGSGSLPEDGKAEITDIGGGWYRCTVTAKSEDATDTGRMVFSVHDHPNASRLAGFTGDGISGIYVWGAQFEQASAFTSYIPTAGTSVTRLADTITTTPPSWTKRIIETVDGEVNVINNIPAIYELPKGNIDQIEFR